MTLIIPLPGNEDFAARLAGFPGFELGRLDLHRFPDGESLIRILSNVTDRDVALVCTLANPDPQFLPLIFAADACRDLGCARVTLVAPYLAYMRQDRQFRQGEAVTSRSFARLISKRFDQLITVDPHLHRYASLADIYRITTCAIPSAPVIATWIADSVPAPVIVGPDEESRQWVADVADRCGAPFFVLSKSRKGDREVEIALPDVGEFRDRQPVLIDDIVSTGHTAAEAAARLVAAGFRKPVCAVVHAIFAEGAFDRLRAAMTRVVSTDTVPHGSNAMSVAALVANAIRSEDC
ncbi:MAG TPA: ribose-phosphate pyrophosphokinase [Ferrovibrio sp.]|uniref:ribose-phosphate pyrophosphokinase n=1 Tax=Ferrovibrio sp. TaxID=1917215 RepID=UPI002B4ACB45|nr:ribose-phosphate pyrophosphokinase [Ferrovibrio sp.]HLT77532.1 ribose-phosphate pyrophosphokinase [Ferrovibrio sp.]